MHRSASAVICRFRMRLASAVGSSVIYCFTAASCIIPAVSSVIEQHSVIPFVTAAASVCSGSRYSACKHGREAAAACICLSRRLDDTGGKNTHLDRCYYSFFRIDANRDDKISGQFTVMIDCKITAAVVCCKPCFTGNTVKFSKSRKECMICSGRHAYFEEVCETHRSGFCCNRNLCTYCVCGFMVAVVA